MTTKYHIIIERKYKKKFGIFKTIEYERPVAGYYDIEYAEGKMWQLEQLHGEFSKIFVFYVEEIVCYNREE